MNAVSVGNASLAVQTFLNIRESTQGRGPLNALSVENASLRAQPFLNIRESTQGRGPLNHAAVLGAVKCLESPLILASLHKRPLE
uniref:Uncharacterized protein n=1 Tax=Chelonoidis abingdonii TaxID=106734 RepID=A0A8C0IZI0_CHEAB